MASQELNGAASPANWPRKMAGPLIVFMKTSVILSLGRGPAPHPPAGTFSPTGERHDVAPCGFDHMRRAGHVPSPACRGERVSSYTRSGSGDQNGESGK